MAPTAAYPAVGAPVVPGHGNVAPLEGGLTGYPPKKTMAPPPPRRGRGILIATLVAAVVIIIAAGVTAFLLLRPDAPPPVDERGAATDVTIQVHDDRVTLRWTDPSNGLAQPLIMGNLESEGQRLFGIPPKGATMFTKLGLNRNYDYCFRVLLAYATDDVRQSDQVCTNRKKANPSPSR